MTERARIILKNIIWSGIFLLPLTPLIITNSLLFPFITGKAFFFRLIVEIIFGLWLILAINLPRYRPPKSWLLWSILAFYFILSLSTIFGVNPSKSFWSNFERMEGLVTQLHLLAYFIVLVSMVKTERLWGWLLHSSLAVNAVIGFYGLAQLLGWMAINQGNVRVDATLGNAAYLAIYEVFHIFFLILLLLKRPKRGLAIIYSVLLLLDFAILYFTATRGAILGLIGGLLLASILMVWQARSNPRVRRSALVGVFAILLFVGAFWQWRDSALVKDNPTLGRFASISLHEASTRFTIWGMAWQGFKERPLLGWGPEGFEYVFQKYYEPSLYGQEPWFDRAHNAIFDWLIAGGLLGLLAYLGLFGTGLYVLWRRREIFSAPEQSIFSGLLAAYFFHNLFVFDNIVSYLLFFAVLGYLQFGWVKLEFSVGNQTTKQLPIFRYGNLTWLAIIPIIVLSVTFFTIRPLVLGHDTIKAIRLSPEGVLAGNDLKEIEKVASSDLFLVEKSFELVLPQTIRVVRDDNYSNELKLDYANLITSLVEKYVFKDPLSARRQLLAGAFLSRLGQFNQAEEKLLTAKELAPRKQAVYQELTNLYIATNRFAQAQEEIIHSYELEPNNPNNGLLFKLLIVSRIVADDRVGALEVAKLASGYYPAEEDLISLTEALNTGQKIDLNGTIY